MGFSGGTVELCINRSRVLRSCDRGGGSGGENRPRPKQSGSRSAASDTQRQRADQIVRFARLTDVEKVENRTTPKISQMVIFGLPRRCDAL